MRRQRENVGEATHRRSAGSNRPAPNANAPGEPASQTSPTADFFVSYTAVDKDWAIWLAWSLKEVGFIINIQAWDFRPGQNFIYMMQQGVLARHTIAVLTPAYLEAERCQQEWMAVLAQDPNGTGRKLVPVRVQPCQPKGLLMPVIYIDLVGHFEEVTARDELFSGIPLCPRSLSYSGAAVSANDGKISCRATPLAKPPFPGGARQLGNPAFNVLHVGRQ